MSSCNYKSKIQNLIPIHKNTNELIDGNSLQRKSQCFTFFGTFSTFSRINKSGEEESKLNLIEFYYYLFKYNKAMSNLFTVCYPYKVRSCNELDSSRM